MQGYHKRVLLTLGVIVALGIIGAALAALGFSSSTGSLGGSGSATPYRFTPGKGLYLLSFTGELAGNYRGDVKVELAGIPAMDYRLVNLAPLRFFAQSQGQELRDQTLVGLKPGDKVALLVLATPQLVKAKSFEVPIASCCVPPETLSSGSEDMPQPLMLSLLQADSGQPLLQIPVTFRSSRR
jgi:hypothetical protein